MKIILLFFLLLAHPILFAQTDTVYIQKLPNTQVVAPHMTLQKFRLFINRNGTRPIYFENYNLGLGVRLKYRKLGVSLSIPIASFDPSNLGDSKAYGLGFGIHPKSFYLQGNLRYIQGLNDLENRVFREDIKAIYFNLYALHLLNSNQFSLRSAFKMIDQQKQSSGSWLLSSVLGHERLIMDSLALNIEDRDLVIDRHNGYRLGVGGGYAYCFVKGDWSLTTLVSGGIEARKLSYQSITNTDFVHRFFVSPRMRLFGSLLRNEEHLFYGLTATYSPGLNVVEGLNTRILDWRIRIRMGWRFF